MSSSNNNQLKFPQSCRSMDRFKVQADQEMDMNLTNGYNSHQTSREAGSADRQMVKNMCPHEL